jgi:hypothetical protein
MMKVEIEFSINFWSYSYNSWTLYRKTRATCRLESGREYKKELKWGKKFNFCCLIQGKWGKWSCACLNILMRNKGRQFLKRYYEQFVTKFY